MKTSIIMPIYNEVELLSAVLERVRAQPFEKEIILVDDCSTDGTRELLEKEKGAPDTIVLFHEKNGGKGRAIRTGLEHATGGVVVIQDADFEYDPNELGGVLAPIWEGKAEVVYGSRFRGQVIGMKLPNYCANMLLAWMVRRMFWVRLRDEATAYKAFRTDVLKSIPLTCERFEFCPEVTARLITRGHKIIEVPISYRARTFEEGKKINWRDFVTAVRTLVKYRFVK